MAGLPRSGSTLLKSLIDQNPNIHTEPVSPVMELMYHTEEYFKQSEQYQGYQKPKNAHNSHIFGNKLSLRRVTNISTT